MRSTHYHRQILAALVIALLVPALAIMFYVPARVSAGSCAEDPSNLLLNGTMAPGPATQYGVVSANWKPFVVGSTLPNFENAPNEGYDPNGSQYIWRDLDAWDAGVYQKVTNLTAGQNYHFWMVWGQALHDMGGDNARATMMNRQIGVDLTGGTVPTSTNVVWTVPYYGGGGFNRPEWNLYFTAASSKATFFLRTQNYHLDGRNKVFFDTVCLYPAGANTPTTTPFSATPAPPTNTPTLTVTPTPTHVPGSLIEDTDASIKYKGSWKLGNNPNASNGTLHYARGAPGSPVVAQFNFTGDQITIWYVTDKNLGKAKVVIDGVAAGVIDQYSPGTTYHLSRTFSGLVSGAHTLKIRNTGGKNPSATDAYIILDALQSPNMVAAADGFQFVSDRPTRTPTPVWIPGKPRLIPFQSAPSAAPTPTDPSVIWDSRLPGLNVSLETANVATGTLYWKLIRADYNDPFEHTGDFGSDHTMYYVITDETGTRIPNQLVWQSWPGDATSALTKSNGIADIAMWANYFPANGPGPYSGYVDGLPSDIVHGMGLPANNHVSFILYFQRTVKTDDGATTSTPTPTMTATTTPTPTNTLTPTPTQTGTAPPTFTPTPTDTRTPKPTRTPTDVPQVTATYSPTPTATSAPATGVQVDDTNSAIQYIGPWSVGSDNQAMNGTFHVAHGTKTVPVIFRYSFTGTQITIWYIGYKDRGRARVFMDGKLLGFLDEYTPGVTYNQSITFTGLAAGFHMLRVKNKGQKNNISTDTYIALDALETK